MEKTKQEEFEEEEDRIIIDFLISGYMNEIVKPDIKIDIEKLKGELAFLYSELMKIGVSFSEIKVDPDLKFDVIEGKAAEPTKHYVCNECGNRCTCATNRDLAPVDCPITYENVVWVQIKQEGEE